MTDFIRAFKQYPVTISLSVLIGVIYLAEVLFSGGLTINLLTMYQFGGMVIDSIAQNGEWWRMLSSGFVHASLTHVLLNIMVIYFVGRILEMALGSIQVGLIFILGVLGGSLLTLLLGNLHVIYVGASTGAFALVGAVIYLGLHEVQRGAWVQEMRTMLLFVVMNLAFSLFDTSIGIWGHVGGFFTGLIVTGALLQSDYAKTTFKTSGGRTTLALFLTLIMFALLFIGVINRLIMGV